MLINKFSPKELAAVLEFEARLAADSNQRLKLLFSYASEVVDTAEKYHTDMTDRFAALHDDFDRQSEELFDVRNKLRAAELKNRTTTVVQLEADLARERETVQRMASDNYNFQCEVRQLKEELNSTERVTEELEDQVEDNRNLQRCISNLRAEVIELREQVRQSKYETFDGVLTPQEVEAGRRHGKIQAIKALRDRTGMSLKDSKEAVEEYFKANGHTFNLRF